MSGVEVVFTGFAMLCVAAGLLAVTSRQVVHAALWLVVALGALAGVYLTLGAEVVALVQLLVYVGAVVVLVLFALMLTRAPIGIRDDLDAPAGRRLGAAVAGLAVAGLLGGVLLVAVGDRTVTPDPARGRATPLGEAVFGGWLLPFELLSVLLLAALVAALAVSRTGTGPDGATNGPAGGVVGATDSSAHGPRNGPAYGTTVNGDGSNGSGTNGSGTNGGAGSGSSTPGSTAGAAR